MIKTINELKNKRITGIQRICDYWQIITDECKVSIYNPVKYCMQSSGSIELRNIRIKDIIEHTIIDVIYKEFDYLKIELENKNTILISLLEKDYLGPEAACIHFCTGQLLVI